MSAVMTSTTSAPATIIAARQSTSARLARFDAWRFIAAIAVIWIHTPRSAELNWTTIFCRFAVPLFVASAAYFAVQSAAKTQNVASYILARLQRIYLPFLAWSGVYLAFKGVKAFLLPEQENDFPGIELLWTGGAYHLWFMPLVLLVCCGSFAIAKVVQRGSNSLRYGSAAVGALAAFGIAVLPAPTSDPSLILMWQAVPGGLLGLALGLTTRGSIKGGSTVYLLIAAILSIVLAWLGRNIAIESLIGVLLLCAALTGSATHLESHLAPLGRLAMGIYLVHLLWLKIIESVAAKLHLAASWQLDVTVLIAVAILSLVTAALLARHRFTAWLVS